MQCESNEEHLGDLTCSICLEIFVEPMQCKEGHIFCKACIEKTLAEKEECPMDRSKLQVADLGRALVVENIIGRMSTWTSHVLSKFDMSSDTSVAEIRQLTDDALEQPTQMTEVVHRLAGGGRGPAVAAGAGREAPAGRGP